MGITKIINQIKWIPTLNITIIDIIQMVILTLIFYYLVNSLYKTRAWILVKGLAIIGIVYLVVCLMGMTVIQLIMRSLFSSLLIAIVIMLQPELQKIVEIIGQKRFTDIRTLISKKQELQTWYSNNVVDQIVNACKTMGKAKTGALIVIERGIPLGEYSKSGIHIGSSVSSQLLINIFEKNTPLHDGAVVIRNNKIESATCYLPLSANFEIDKNLGTRHRAALGASENSDCIVVVVSEETGAISLCVNGNIKHNIELAELSRLLTKYMSKQDETFVHKKKSKSPLWIKILTPILGVIVWISVITISDPLITKTIANVQVTTINAELLDDAGQTYSIQSGNTISVKVQGRRSLVESITKNDLSAVADFSEMSMVYSVPIRITPSAQYKDVEILSENKMMKLEIENLVQTELPIYVDIVGDDNNDYVVHVSDIGLQKLIVTCPQSVSKTLDKAILTVDASGKETNFISNVAPIIYDKNGSIVSSNQIKFNQETIAVTVDVYEVKELPISISFAEQDKTADAYYVFNGYKAEFNKIRVASNDETMANLQEICIIVSPDINSESANSILVNLKQHLPENVYLAKNQEDQLSIELDLIKYQKKIIDLPIDNVKKTGYDAKKFTATIINAPQSIVLYYDVNIVDGDSITLESLNPTIKIQEKKSGQYEGKMIITDIDGVIIQDELIVQYKLNQLR